MKLDGKQIAETISLELKKRVGELKKKNITPHLVVILVGENPASMAYVLQKQKKGESIGAKVTVLRYKETVTTDELAKKVKELNHDPSVHGILIQRPLPNHIDVTKLERLTDPQKDIDGFHPKSPYTLPLPLAVVKILEEIYCIETMRGVTEVKGLPAARSSLIRLRPDQLERARRERNFWQDPERHQWLKSKNIIVLGKGPTGGGPVIEYFKTLGVNPKVIDSKTPNPNMLMQQADIIVAATGREDMVKPEMLKKGVVLIGVGILRGSDGKLHGDYDTEKIKDIVSFYTPTPGGVGPVNVAMLLENLVTAAEKF